MPDKSKKAEEPPMDHSEEAALSRKRGHEVKQAPPAMDAAEGSLDASREPSSVSSDTSQAPKDPPLPDEPLPPLPNEIPPEDAKADDGWEPVWDPTSSAFYFFNRITGVTQWDNPRVPVAPGSESEQFPEQASREDTRPVGGYNPAIHGDYDPTAPYALEAKALEEQAATTAAAAAAAAMAAAQTTASSSTEPDYSAAGNFNRFTGKWQAADVNPDNFNDESKSHRQLSAFYDVDSYNHDGRSLKAERSQMKLSKAQVKAFKQKRKERKEEKRRAWLRD